MRDEPESKGNSAVAAPGVLVILGASGDLTKRLLMPALYNLACDGLLPEEFAVVGMARRDLDTNGSQITGEVAALSDLVPAALIESQIEADADHDMPGPTRLGTQLDKNAT